MPALEAGMVLLGDRYIFSLMARARVRGVPAGWLENVLEFAMVPDQVYLLDVDVEHLLPRVMANRELDHWESGDDFLREPDRYDSFIRYQSALILQFRSMAEQYGFATVDARRSVREVFEDLQAGIGPVLEGMKRE